MQPLIQHETRSLYINTKMTCKLLRIFFFIGTILAITPTLSSKSKNLPRKIYTLFIFIFLTTGGLIYLKYRSFYGDSFFMKRLFMYLNDSILILLNFHVIVVYNFWGRPKWAKFLEKLATSKKMTIFEKKSKCEGRLAFLPFVVSHVVFLSVHVYGSFVWYRIFGLEAVTKFGVKRIEEYITFFYLLLFCYILHMLWARYKGLNNILSLYVSHNKRFSDEVARTTGYVFCYLKDIVDTFNDLFGWPILLIVYHTISQLLIYLFSMVTTTAENYDVLSSQICTVSFIMFTTTIFLLMCDKVTQEAQKSVALSYKLRWSWQQLNQFQKQELYQFTALVNGNLPQFTAANFFVVGKFTIIYILAAAGSTLVILLQFNNK